MTLATLYYGEDLDYTGSELAPHFIFKRFKVRDNAIVAFCGAANVSIEHMVDLEDVQNDKPIYSPRMLHFLGEFFIDSLDQGILLQHLFVDQVYQWLWENLSLRGNPPLSKRGNDLFYDGRKLSVSIATRSPVSVLMHMGINIRTEGTPVPTAGLAELDISPERFAGDILRGFTADWDVYRRARTKVLPR
jgi:hypothetical protein